MSPGERQDSNPDVDGPRAWCRRGAGETLAIVPVYLRTPVELQVVMDCLESLRRTAPGVLILVVDDASPEQHLVDEIDAQKSRLDLRLMRQPANQGFSRTVNVGMRLALNEGWHAVLVNSDIEFFDSSSWLEAMQQQPRSDGGGPAEVVGGLLLYPNGLIQHAGIFFSLLSRSFGHIYQYGPADLPEAQFARRCPVTGALQFIRHETLRKVGLYDESFRMGWEDVDYCIRTFEAGGECVMQPTVRAFHHESLFRGTAAPGSKLHRWQQESWVTFLRKYSRTSFAEWIPSL